MGTQSLCQAADCLKDRHSGAQQVRTAAPGLRLCAVCRDRLRDNLRSLPDLYANCGAELTPSRPGLTERVSSGRSRQGIRLNEAALEARGDLLPVLASWAGVVVAERHVAGPRRREVGTLAAFLRLHLDWLAAHPAAADCVAEIRRVTNMARAAVLPRPVVQQELGPCPVDDCGEEVRARLRTDDPAATHVLRCGAGHVVPPHQWLLLSGRTA
ncbi:MAG: hypothetical protein WCD21_25385 [Streptomyces sp.]